MSGNKIRIVNNAIINFTSAMCPQIIKNGFYNIAKSIPFIVSFILLGKETEKIPDRHDDTCSNQRFS